jgi:outer membrane biosynthesis protein TonB
LSSEELEAIASPLAEEPEPTFEEPVEEVKEVKPKAPRKSRSKKKEEPKAEEVEVAPEPEAKPEPTPEPVKEEKPKLSLVKKPSATEAFSQEPLDLDVNEKDDIPFEFEAEKPKEISLDMFMAKVQTALKYAPRAEVGDVVESIASTRKTHEVDVKYYPGVMQKLDVLTAKYAQEASPIKEESL